MKHFDLENVRLTSGYLFDKQELNRNTTINAVYDRFSETGRIGAFDCEWKEGEPNKPHWFWDSDVAKWMEGAAYILARHDAPELKSRVERLIDAIERNQGEDGYFNIYFTVCEPQERFKHRSRHELYCAGHLIEAAIAYHRATGERRFLDCVERYADFIYKVFIEEKSASFDTPGHEEIELALFRLYRHTGKEKYRELAAFFLDNRSLHGRDDQKTEYDQSHKPIREQFSAVGHAVRVTYLCAAMADHALEFGDEAVLRACHALYEDISQRKMYITGGLGSTDIGEAFTYPYDLPNDGAYTETCAGIGLMFFTRRMLELENDAAYADTMERVLYNGVLSGLSLDGKSFFYENPLEVNLGERFGSEWGMRRFPQSRRAECFDCSCCPPNINRLLASLSEYVYGIDGDTLFVNLFAGSELECGEVKCTMTTNYPIDGKVNIKASGVGRIAVRIPGWCDKFNIDRDYTIERGYAYIENGGEVNIEFDMTPFAVQSNSRVARDVNKLCVQAGPIVYCAESIDNGEGLHALSLPRDIECRVEYDEVIGLNTLAVSGYRTISGDALYSRATDNRVPTDIKLIPYSSFANREPCDMLVWFDERT